MQTLSPDEQRRLEGELSAGESIVWSGRPNPSVIFHGSDLFMIPFSLLWGGFAIFWETAVTGYLGSGHGRAAPSVMVLFGIPFVLIGQYLIWGRFFYAAWKKKRTLYAITNRRVLVLSLASGSQIVSAFLENIPAIDREVRADGIGTLKFGQIPNSWAGGRNYYGTWDSLHLNSGIPVFVDIDDAASVYNMVADLHARTNRS
jgi:hypothetical protein